MNGIRIYPKNGGEQLDQTRGRVDTMRKVRKGKPENSEDERNSDAVTQKEEEQLQQMDDNEKQTVTLLTR